MTNTKNIIRIIYLYLFSLVGLVLIVVASVSLLDLGLKATIFRQADQYPTYPEYPMPRSAVEKPIPGATEAQIYEPTAEEKAEYEKKLAEYEKENRRRERERTASRSLAMLLVGIPLFLYHWRKVQEKE